MAKNHLLEIEKKNAAVDQAQAAASAVRSSIHTLAEAKKIAATRLASWVEAGARHLEYTCRGLGQEGPPPRISFFGENGSAAEAVFAFVNADRLQEITSLALEAQYAKTGPAVLSPKDRPAAIAKAEAALFKAEQELEKAIEEAEGDGLTIQRRSDVSAESILGLKRGEQPAHNWFSEKMERIVGEREGGHGAMDAARDKLQAAQRYLAKVSAGGAPDEETREAAEQAVARARKVFAARQDELVPKIAVAGLLEDYVRTHRLPKPCVPFHDPFKRPEPAGKQEMVENWQARFEDADSPEDTDEI